MITREIHPTHDPEPDQQRAYRNATLCRTCGWFITFDEPHGAPARITKHGVEPCDGAYTVPLGY